MGRAQYDFLDTPVLNQDTRPGVTFSARGDLYMCGRPMEPFSPFPHPPWRQPSGKSQVNLPSMTLDSGDVCMGSDLRNHRFVPGLPPGWFRRRRSRIPLGPRVGSVPETRHPNPTTLNPKQHHYPLDPPPRYRANRWHT